MYTPILIGIGAVLLINIILLFCLLLRKPADPSSSLREELRGVRQDTQAGQAEMRRELNTQLTGIHQMSLQTVSKLSENTLQNLESMRITLDRRLEGMRRENQTAMEQLRRSVDEQLSTTLTTGLNNSFKSVSLQLEQVSRNINEVQNMAPDIQKLHNILANVKNRGTWGEVQLGSIISDLFAPAQYESQFAITNNAERVDYAIRLPGQQHEVYLPIDAKFPMDRYTAYLSAESQGNPVLTDTAKAALLRAVKDQAKDIARKYISPPYTTDFAILFVPSEGLYALLASEEFAYTLQQEYKILLAGPVNLAALLNSLQMGFKTLAIQQRSSDIMHTLQAVNTSLSNFAKNLEATRKSLRAAANNLDKTFASVRGIQQKLRSFETLSDADAQEALGDFFPDMPDMPETF